MKNIIVPILFFILLFSCTSYNQGNNLNTQNAELAHSKFSNLNNDFTYEKYKSLIIEYAKNSKFPDINK